ncbi:hypothetical protein DV515_00014600 [Chloebia gouldiae]|uniref:BTB domain-containing protein n=1 Tax=Chloebia gouldiae TaxID=44316 RepID=A0A3L8RY49_CHLGU|nr:hypothetical protein DV515_00014600 [Chloebia gouldiae]
MWLTSSTQGSSKLNQQRQQGQLCDVSIVVQGHLFRAHKAVLAASSPYFCDQVLLKNSRRIVLPDVMNPRVFENILLSTYTGRLVMPAPEIVSYLTAASFLQMWHVVDKCTEVLEGNPTVLCQKMNHGSDHQSPSSSSYNGLVETFELGSGGQTEFHKVQELRDGENEEESSKDELSCQLTEHEYLPSNSSTEHDRLSTGMTSQDGEEGTSDSAEYQYTRPMYSKPSIMSHKRWIHVKPERFEQDCEGVDNPYDEHQVSESMNTIQADHSIQSSGVEDFHIGDKKMEAEFDEQADEGNYDEQVDFYGSSMEEFSGERADGNLSAHRQDLMMAAGYGESIDMAAGIKEETSLTGFSHADKLYPCQCGKSFTHKSQRDRHMSMHLGLRPYGCGVCGQPANSSHASPLPLVASAVEHSKPRYTNAASVKLLTSLLIEWSCSRKVISEVTIENVHADRKIPEHSLHSSINHMFERERRTYLQKTECGVWLDWVDTPEDLLAPVPLKCFQVVQDNQHMNCLVHKLSRCTTRPTSICRITQNKKPTLAGKASVTPVNFLILCSIKVAVNSWSKGCPPQKLPRCVRDCPAGHGSECAISSGAARTP